MQDKAVNEFLGEKFRFLCESLLDEDMRTLLDEEATKATEISFAGAEKFLKASKKRVGGDRINSVCDVVTEIGT